jgi:hypothetical protein
VSARDRLAAALHASIEAFPRHCDHRMGRTPECEWLADAVLTWRTDLWQDIEDGAALRRLDDAADKAIVLWHLTRMDEKGFAVTFADWRGPRTDTYYAPTIREAADKAREALP